MRAAESLERVGLVGWSARLDGSAYDPAEHEGGLLLAPDEASWAALHEALFTSRPE